MTIEDGYFTGSLYSVDLFDRLTRRFLGEDGEYHVMSRLLTPVGSATQPPRIGEISLISMLLED